MAPKPKPLTVTEAAHALNTSLSTVWRMLKAGTLRSVQSGGLPAHPFVRMVGAYKSGGRGPGSEDKRAALFSP